ncbi:MAG: Uma2 family endonuclease [Thermoleophilaceae bacterium]
MGATATTSRMTAEQYHAVSVEGDRKQLVEGAIVVNDPKPIHGALQVRLASALHTWADGEEGRGLVLLSTDIRMDEHNVYGPDLMWFAEAHRPADLREYPERVPDLCVEIRSPGTWRYDVGAKKAVYERAGLPELWLVDDLAETVLAFRRSAPGAEGFDVALELGRGAVLESPRLSRFALALDALFDI